jgi:hypothetical protein
MVCTVKSVVIGSAVRGKHNRVQDVIYTRIQFYICTTIVIITSTPVMLLTKIIHQCSENKFLSNLGCSETYYIMRTHVRPKSFENRGTRWVCEKVAQNVAKTIFFKIITYVKLTEKISPKMRGTSVILKITSIVNNHSKGEKSPNLVTL